jgi:plastocyanin
MLWFLAAIIGAAVSSPQNKGDNTAKAIAIDNFKFSPSELTVSPGTTVTWTNHDDVPHTVTSTDTPPAFDSKALDTDGTYSFTFTRPGVFSYRCNVHHHMTGTITVK